MEPTKQANLAETLAEVTAPTISRGDFLRTVGLSLAATSLPSIVTAEEADKKEAVQLKVGDSFPDIKLEGVNGKIIDALEGAKGKLALVVFWGPQWCPPCMAEIPHIKEAAHKLDGKEFTDPKSGDAIGSDFAVISVAVNYKSTLPTWQRKVTDGSLPGKLHVGTLDFDQISDSFGVSGFPTNFVIDGGGKIIMENADIPSLHLALGEYLKE